MEDLLHSIASGMVTGLFSAGAVWGMLKTELKYLRRDVDLAHTRIDKAGERCITNHQEVHS